MGLGGEYVNVVARQCICQVVGFTFYVSGLKPEVKMSCQEYQDADQVHEMGILAVS